MKKINLQVCGSLLALALAAPAVVHAQNTFDGTWQAGFVLNNQQCSLNLVMNAGRYSEQARCGSLMTLQSGVYTFSGNLLVRTVHDFEPKRRYVVDGRRLEDPRYNNVPAGHWEDNATPPGGTYQVSFTSPNTMTWHDVNFGGNVTFHRVR
jgi:hypothetical protein